eukprot:749153-Hanusia_phi.AAC.3
MTRTVSAATTEEQKETAILAVRACHASSFRLSLLVIKSGEVLNDRTQLATDPSRRTRCPIMGRSGPAPGRPAAERRAWQLRLEEHKA